MSERIQSGRLLIESNRCSMLTIEGGLYHYDPDESFKCENRLDQDNQAFGQGVSAAVCTGPKMEVCNPSPVPAAKP